MGKSGEAHQRSDSDSYRRRSCHRTRANDLAWTLDQKKFTEPVALSSPEPVGFPLSRTALRPSFDLLALRSRCKEDTTTHTHAVQEGENRNVRSLHYFHCPHTNRAIRAACSREVGPELTGRELTTSSLSVQKRNSPTRWHVRPPNQLTFRLRVQPLGPASIYLRSVVGASGNLFLPATGIQGLPTRKSRSLRRGR